MIYKIPTLRPIDRRILQEIGELRERLRLYLHVPPHWRGGLRRAVMARAMRYSTAIEGYKSSGEDAAALVEGEEEVEADRETRDALAGYRDVLTLCCRWPKVGRRSLLRYFGQTTFNERKRTKVSGGKFPSGLAVDIAGARSR